MFCIKCGAECEDYEEGGILRQRCPRCGHIHYQNPYPCIAVLVVNEQGKYSWENGIRSRFIQEMVFALWVY